MNKIKRVSQIFRILFQIGFVAAPIALVLTWWFAPHSLATITNSCATPTGVSYRFIPATQILHPLSAETKFFGFLVSIIPTGIQMFLLYFLIKLFRLYEHAEIFSLAAVKYIKRIGYTLLIGQAAYIIYQALITGILTWGNPSGHRTITIGFGSPNFAIVLTALIVILISWIMEEGCKLRDEQQYTV